MALTNKNHQIIRDHFTDRGMLELYAIDATCGNGHDSLFLTKLGFKCVYAFDIQQQAIDNTKQLIEGHRLNNIRLIKAGHETTTNEINDNVDCVMFNLGYLPSADKNLTTNQKTTLSALKQSLALLNNGGIISILCYPGHTHGALETKAIQLWLESVDKQYKVTEVLASHPNPKAPVLYLIEKI